MAAVRAGFVHDGACGLICSKVCALEERERLAPFNRFETERNCKIMFTGIVEETGVVMTVTPTDTGIRLAVRVRRCAAGLKIGDSLAVNGCCLTAVRIRRARAGRIVEFDLLAETWRRTNLQFVRPGSAVNLERPLRASDRLGGHFVTGHIDAMGRITRWEQSGKDWVLEVAADAAQLRQMVAKGSIAVDGISLTVAAVKKRGFQVWIIPHTREITALGERLVGDPVNLETDLLAKHVERLIEARGAETRPSLRKTPSSAS
jgi:riboflavin synthase